MKKLKGCGAPMMSPNNDKRYGARKTKYTAPMYIQRYLIAKAQVKRLLKGYKRTLRYSSTWIRNMAMLLQDIVSAETNLGGIKQSTKNAINIYETLIEEELNCFY